MKIFLRALFICILSAVFVGTLMLIVTMDETTAVAKHHPSLTQNNTGIFTTNAVSPTIFLPIFQKPAPQLPQGNGLLFISDRAETEKYDIYKMNLDGSNVSRLTHFSIESEVGFNHKFHPRWSPDGTKITVQIEGALHILAEDGSLLETLLDEPMMAVDGVPAWSPDGQKIAYIAKDCEVARPLCNEFTGGGVRIIDVQTKAITQSIPDGIFIYSSAGIAWHPNGRSVFAVRTGSGGSDNGLMIGYLDGSSYDRILTDYFLEEFEVSPNGQKFVFVASSNFKAYTADYDGTNVQEIFDGASDLAVIYHITWHSSGTRLAYAIARNSGYDRTIYVANADGSGAHDILPSMHSLSLYLWGWTSDSSKIIFNSDKNRDWRHYDIYTINENGSNIKNITPDSPRDDIASD